MALFNPASVQSEEVAALLLSQSILSRSAALQALLEASSEAEAAALIVVGPSEPPFDGESYTIDELASRHAWAQLYPQRGGSLVVSKSFGTGGRPEIAGMIELHVRRQVKAIEYKDVSGRNDVWLYFDDQTARMMEDYGVGIDESVQNATLRASAIKRLEIPLFNNHADHETQGIFIYADFVISWGDQTRQQ